MRHRKKVKKLGRPTGHRKALLRNLASQIILHHEIKTTLAKAKAARSFIERLITYAKKDTVHARRLAFKQLQNRTLVKKLFDEIGPAFEDRNGGYTRVIKLGQRRGDGAELAILQLVGFESSMVETPKKAKKQKAKPKAQPAEEKTPEAQEASANKGKKKPGKPKKESPAVEKEASSVEETPQDTAAEEKTETADAAEKPSEESASQEDTAPEEAKEDKKQGDQESSK